MFRKGKTMVKQDRRIRKTRAVLKNALLSLMTEKSVKHITVKELCEKADINRGTFYLHFKDVFDMLEQIEDDMFQSFHEYMNISENESLFLSEDKLKDIFSFVQDNSDFCRVMLSDKGEIGFTRKLIKFLHDKFTASFENTNVVELYFSFMVYGFLGLIENWLNTGMKESPEEMAKICDNLINNKLKEKL